jgi:tetratricopeptide (TPR) repeat protein
MAQKLNKKLVFVVGSLLIALVVGGAGILFFRYRTDAERHIRAGDQLLAAGDARRAAESYGRAVAKKSNNTAYLEKFRDATLLVKSETENDARERYGQYLQSLASLARVERVNVNRWRDYLRTLDEQAEVVGAPSNWKALADVATEMSQAMPAGGAGRAVAAVYAGYAGARRAGSLDESEREKLVADLKIAAESPDLSEAERDLAYGAVARMAVFELARARAGAGEAQVAAAVAKADAALAAAGEKSPKGLQAAIARFERAIVDAGADPQNPALLASTDALIETAQAHLDRGFTVLSLAGVLSRAGRPGVESATELLGQHIERNPNALMHRRARAVLLRPLDRVQALSDIEAVLAMERPATGIVAASFEGNRISAAQIRFDILHDGLSGLEGAVREEALAKVSAARDALAGLLMGAADDSPLLRADAKVALAKLEFANAQIKLNEIFRKGSSIDLELHVLSAIAAQQLGETGRALELVNGGLRLAPDNAPLLKLRADLEVRAGRPQEALATLRTLRSLTPEDQDIVAAERQVERILANDPSANAGAGMSDAVADLFGQVQTKLDAEDFEGARRIVEGMKLTLGERDPRVDRLAVVVEMQARDTARATELAKAGLERFPGDALLVRLSAVLASDDPVARVVAMMDVGDADETTRTVLTYVRMRQAAAMMADQASRETRTGMPSAAETAETATRLEAGVTEWRAKADAADRAHPILIEADFRDAIAKRDFAAAAATVALAKQSGRDPTQAPLLESQLFFEQGKRREATELLERTIAAGIDTSTVFRALGTMLEQQGNLDGAITQYEESYRRRPSDMSTVRLLVGATVRGGNLQRALEVLRSARQLAGFDEEVGDVWLSLESQIGDRRLALRLRENQYRATPADERNAIGLANTLSTTAPERADVLTERGDPAYSESAWSALTEPQRNAALDRVRAQWRKRAEEILVAALRRTPASLVVAENYATLLRSLGREAEAEKAVVDAVAAAGDSAGWRGYLVLGGLQLQMGRAEAAAETFRRATALENAETRDATLEIAALLISQDRYADALPYLEDAVRVVPQPFQKLRLCECLLRVGRLDDARQTLASVLAAGGARGFTEEMLDGSIFIAEGDRARNAGDVAAARTAYEAALPPFSRAKGLAPAAAQTFMQDAIAKRRLFELTGERARFEEARAAADRAIALAASFFPASAVRADVLLSNQDVAGALGELDRFLRLVPSSVEGRRRAVELALLTGNTARAEAYLREAIGYAPGEASWHFAIGDVLSRLSRHGEAAAAFSRADTLRPEPVSVLREMESRIRARDFRGVTETARRRGDFIRTSTAARALTGVALIAAGERGDGSKTLAEAYAEASVSSNPQALAEWYGAIELLFTPADLAAADEFLKRTVGADLTPRARLFLSGLAIGSGSGGPQKALEYLGSLESVDYSADKDLGAMVFDRFGTASYLSGDCTAAIAAYEKALGFAPDFHPILNNYAYLCGECLKDAKRGLPSARRAVQMQPTRPEYLDTLGTLLIADGEHREALEYLDRAARIADSAALQYHRAQALLGLGQRAEALTAAQRAGSMNPDEQTRRGLAELEPKLR